ncbi:YhjD/YihY/BrkB family envelope integrity protein [Amycolatopsis sp. GM8]|uniref:YhjD/YihY/BrkB family envelope integrity protein n=1 Tax=Amycolatopsis sp. GM8 TaxID=2896530 RepID=UPI001F209027|nr:YhjD/YihY/BrkB family envelope integrity protein [Amycolatopsis sp. GM8]
MIDVRATLRRCQAGIDAGAARYPPVAVLVEMARRDRAISGRLLAAALAFRIFVWLLPCTLLVVAVLGFIAKEAALPDLAERARLSPLTRSLLEQIGGQAQQGRYVVGGVGLVSLAFASTALGRTLDGVRGRAIPGLPPGSRRAGVARAARYAGILLTIALTGFLGPLIQSATDIPTVVVSVVTLGIFIALGIALLRTDPLTPRRDLVPGAVLFALGLEVLRLVAAYFLPAKLTRASELYGALGVAAALLVWLTLMARLVVLGHLLNAVLVDRHHTAVPSRLESS